jgi:hypothetical protein
MTEYLNAHLYSSTFKSNLRSWASHLVPHINAIYFKIYPKMTDMDGIKNELTGTSSYWEICEDVCYHMFDSYPKSSLLPPIINDSSYRSGVYGINLKAKLWSQIPLTDTRGRSWFMIQKFNCRHNPACCLCMTRPFQITHLLKVIVVPGRRHIQLTRFK